MVIFITNFTYICITIYNITVSDVVVLFFLVVAYIIHAHKQLYLLQDQSASDCKYFPHVIRNRALIMSGQLPLPLVKTSNMTVPQMSALLITNSEKRNNLA